MSKRRKSTIRRVDEEFAKFLDEIKKSRIVVGKDDLKHVKADWRITLALVRHPLLKSKIKDDIVNAELID